MLKVTYLELRIEERDARFLKCLLKGLGFHVKLAQMMEVWWIRFDFYRCTETKVGMTKCHASYIYFYMSSNITDKGEPLGFSVFSFHFLEL